MAASYQSKDSRILGQQLKVQELTCRVGNPITSVVGLDLVIDVSEPVADTLMCVTMAPLTGVLTGYPVTPVGTTIVVVGGAAIPGGDSVMLKYIVSEE